MIFFLQIEDLIKKNYIMFKNYLMLLMIFFGALNVVEAQEVRGTVLDDSAFSLVLGNVINPFSMLGRMGWARISDSVRYTTSFTPIARDAPPASDANTIEPWNLDEGSGTTAAAQVASPTNDGTIANGSWGSE